MTRQTSGSVPENPLDRKENEEKEQQVSAIEIIAMAKEHLVRAIQLLQTLG